MMTRAPEHPQKPLPPQKAAQSLRSLKGAAEPANSNEIWLLTLSDLLMLLLIFFVFLLAAPVVQAGRSVKSAPQNAIAAFPAERQKTASMISGGRGTTVPVIGQTSGLSDRLDAATLEDDLHAVMNHREDGKGVTVERRSQFLVITFPEQILFASGQARTKTAAGPTLEKVAAFIISHPELSVEVQGHTDDRPIRSHRYPSNWELSADRATQVAKALLDLGANPERVATRGFGEYHPIVPNTSDENRLKNRRVEIQFSLHRS